jgi:hypothetical protein
MIEIKEELRPVRNDVTLRKRYIDKFNKKKEFVKIKQSFNLFYKMKQTKKDIKMGNPKSR